MTHKPSPHKGYQACGMATISGSPLPAERYLSELLKMLHAYKMQSAFFGPHSPQTLVTNQEKFGPHKVDPTRFAGFFLLGQEVA